MVSFSLDGNPSDTVEADEEEARADVRPQLHVLSASGRISFSWLGGEIRRGGNSALGNRKDRA